MPRRKPKSDVRKALSRLNAVQHGLTANAPVIPGESLEAWIAFRAALIDNLALVGALEAALGELIATLFWELARVSRYERDAIQVAIDRVESDFAESRRTSFRDLPLSVAEAGQRLDDARRCLDIIDHLTDTPPVTPIAADDVSIILDGLAARAEQFKKDYLRGIEEASAAEPWTYGRLLAVLEALAARDDDEFPDLLVDMLAGARRIVLGCERLVAEVEDELALMRRERSIPSGATMEAILRYGGSKNRQLYQALNQLESLQARRAGRPTNLNRVQLFGLPGA